MKNNPMEVTVRHLMLKELRKLKPEDVYEVEPKFVNVFEEILEDGTDATVYEINWEYALFDADLNRLDALFQAFEPKEAKKKVDLLIPEQKIIIP